MIAVLRQKRPSATISQIFASLNSRGTAVTDTRNNVTPTRINVWSSVSTF